MTRTISCADFISSGSIVGNEADEGNSKDETFGEEDDDDDEEEVDEKATDEEFF